MVAAHIRKPTQIEALWRPYGACEREPPAESLRAKGPPEHSLGLSAAMPQDPIRARHAPYRGARLEIPTISLSRRDRTLLHLAMAKSNPRSQSLKGAAPSNPSSPAPATAPKAPAELQAKFDADPAFQKAFTALTPGRQRGYIFHFSDAKQSATRTARIEKCAPKILQGRGLLDRDKTPATPKPVSTSKPTGEKAKPAPAAGAVKLLSGGNPQIPKGDGDAPVQAYITALPGWKQPLAERLDLLITLLVPEVRKAVKWNSPFYGVEGQGWFLNLHAFTHYLRLTFFAGASLKPTPPGHTPKSGEARWLDLHETTPFDEKRLVTWIKQAAVIPGWTP